MATDGSAPGHADDCYIVLLLRKHGNPDDFHAAWNRRAASDAPADGREAVDERAAFEADAKRLGMPLENSGGHYANIRTRNRWLGWQARAALATAPTMSEGVRDVLAERRRQVEQEGWTPEHDDQHAKGEMAFAAASYAMSSARHPLVMKYGVPGNWPWAAEWWKPTTRRHDLVKAGALILAEIERIDRAGAKGGSDA